VIIVNGKRKCYESNIKNICRNKLIIACEEKYHNMLQYLYEYVNKLDQ